MSFLVKEKYFYKTFFNLTLAIALQNVIVFGVNLADNIMIGAYSETAMSGIALVNQIQFLLQMMINGVAEGVVVLASRAWGRKDMDEIKKVSSIGMLVGCSISLILMAIINLFPHWTLSLLTNETEIIEVGVRYMHIVSISYVFFAITSILLASLRSIETVKIGYAVNIAALVFNIGLNYLLIFGNFGFPELGAEGAAIATLISRIVETVVIVIYLKFFDKKIRLKLKSFFYYEKKLFVQFIKVGMPIIASGTSWGIAMGVQTSILGHMGGAAIAANSIATTVFQVITVVSNSSASGASVLIGKTIGEGKVDVVKNYAKTLQILFLGIGAVTGIILFVFKDIVINFYSVSEETRILALQFMTILSITSVGTSYQMPCLCGIVRGGGDTKFVLYNDIIFMWGLVLPSAFTAAYILNMSPVIVFICLKADQILKCSVAVVKVNRYKWIKIFDDKKKIDV